jgi:hypothetical protein
MPSDVDLRGLIVDIIDEMSDRERKTFVFLLGDDIPKRKRDAELVEIFEILMDRGRISSMDCSYLMNMLDKMKLTTLAYKVALFETRKSLFIFLSFMHLIFNFYSGHSPSTKIDNLPLIDNTRPITPPSTTIESPRKAGLTQKEFLSDFNSPDSMIIIPGKIKRISNNKY